MIKTPQTAASLYVSEHGDGLVILDSATGQVFVTNQVGASIWAAVSMGRTLDDISNDIAARFGMASERARHDVGVFLVKLERYGLVRRVPK